MIKLKKMNFIKNEKGALTFEFAIVFMGCMLVFFLVYDIYMTIALQGKLDRTTYSAATVFRERSIFYNGDPIYPEAINQQQVLELESLLNSMMSPNNVSMKVEALYIKADDKNPENIETAKMDVKSFCGSSSCNSSYFSTVPSLTTYKKLTAYSTSMRWIPIFRVLACIKNSPSLFKKAMNKLSITDTPEEICSSSIVVSRCTGECNIPFSSN